MKKAIVLITILAMVISLLPMQVAALEIGYVSLNVTAPAVDASPVFQATCNHDNYIVDTAYKDRTNGVSWYDETGKKLTASDRFAEGHKYTVTVILEPTTGNKFALDTDVGVHTAVSGSINDSSAKVSLTKDSMLKIAVSRTFVLSEKISSVSVTDIIAPAAEQKPEYDGMVTDDGYQLLSDTFGNFQHGVYWQDLTDSKTLGAEDTFVEGHKYRVYVCLNTKNGEYEFQTDASGNPQLTAYVNGNEAKPIKVAEKDAKNLIAVYYDFPACPKAQVTTVNIENLPIPQAGKAPEYTAVVTTGGLMLADVNNTFTKNGICWSDKAQGFDLTPTGFFYSGYVYIATLRLNIKQGYELKQPIAATVNGKSATATVSGGQLIIKCEVECPDYKIDKIDITGVEVPAIGNSPSKEMQCAEPNLYSVKDISWYMGDEFISESDKFIAGKNYDLVVYVDPKQEGWNYVAYFADKVAVTVNGNAVSENKVERVGNSVKFTYTFTAAASAKIGTVDIIGIDAPVAGKSPDYTAELINSDTYMIDTTLTDRHTSQGVMWRNVTEARAMLAGVDKFEKGTVYEVMVTVTPHKGYTFVTGSDGTPNITGTINGETATDIMGRSDVEAIIVYKFPVCEEAAEAPEEPENTDKPQTTEKPSEANKPTQTGGSAQSGNPSQNGNPVASEKSTFTDISKGEYYYEPVMWAVENNITAGTSATTFSPNSICTRAQVVTFLHRLIGSPEPAAIDMPFADVATDSFYYKPVKWAVGSKITGGTSATTFSPNDNCTRAQVVTFLWRSAGQPKASGEDNPFTDVSADSYYYDAVLWAVENGITGGTSATTFSPDAGCTRAQVVTFLYRFIKE